MPIATRNLDCPECKHGITLVETEANPATHGYTVCGVCGAFVTWVTALDNSIAPRLMTEDDILAMDDEARIEMTAMRRHIQRHGKVTGPQLSDDRLAAIIDGAKLEVHEPRIIAAELLARRARDHAPPLCPDCNGSNVAVTLADFNFKYTEFPSNGAKRDEVTLTARDVETLRCLDCNRQYTDDNGERSRRAAIDEYLGREKP